jgi:hypothetical protein
MSSPNGNRRTPYEEMKEVLDCLNEGVKRGQGWTVTSGERCILAMDRSNDPFYAGQGYQAGLGKWFADLHQRLGFANRRSHLRFIHYVASGEEPNPETGEKLQERLPDGTPYENTDDNWSLLVEASKHARNMELVDPRLIVDRRTPRPFLNGPTEPAPEPTVDVYEPELTLPEIEVDALEPSLNRARFYTFGYSYTTAHEPSLIELWVEKNLDDADTPLIEGLCEELGVNLVTGIGFMTISSVYALLERRATLDKPLRILYLSDFDPAGEHMPVGPARHIEFAIRNMPETPDIRLHHLALTHEQVRARDLPRIPIKDSDKRKENFERKRGVGATELNAMMAETRVVDFEEILRSAVLSLRDRDLRRKLRQAQRGADAGLREEIGRRMHWPHRALELLEQQAQEIGERYTEELQDIANRLAAEIAPLEERRERVLCHTPKTGGCRGHGTAVGRRRRRADRCRRMAL